MDKCEVHDKDICYCDECGFEIYSSAIKKGRADALKGLEDIRLELQYKINYFMEIEHREISPWAKTVIEKCLLSVKEKITALQSQQTVRKNLKETSGDIGSGKIEGVIPKSADTTHKNGAKT